MIEQKIVPEHSYKESYKPTSKCSVFF